MLQFLKPLPGNLQEAGCRKPVIVVRHELQRWFTPEEQQQNRRQIRDRYTIADDTLLIGMVGEFKSQKAYTRAVRVLAEIRKIRPVKLMILGGWDHEWGNGREAHTATYMLALELGVITDLITPGSVPDVEKYYAAFDVFLNTSVFEGLSVALLEAIQTGCPIVTADAGGNREILPERAVLVENSSEINAYVHGIAQALEVQSRVIVQKPDDFDLVPRLWSLLGQYGRNDSFSPISARDTTLFITDNLNSGGTQRSLTHLLCRLPPAIKRWLCVLQTLRGQGYLDELKKNNVPVFSVQNSGDYMERTERILCMIGRLNVNTICFWNVDARIKLLLAKILPRDALRLVDVSPDSFLFYQMEHAAAFQRRIAFPAQDYWARLDHFVVKYAGGGPANIRLGAQKLSIIPDGVSVPKPCEPAFNLLPKGADLNLVIGPICPITPGKRMEFIIDMMGELNRQLSGATLIIIGGLDMYHANYWPVLLESLRKKGITNVHFAGPHTDTTSILKLFKVFLEVSEWQGISYNSLEALSLGIPVINAGDSKAMAQQVCLLLKNSALRISLGTIARKTATQKFSMKTMIRRYSQLFAKLHP